MTSSHDVDRLRVETVKSRIGQSLIRLHRTLERTREEESRVDSLFLSWQQKWSDRREQISRRLSIIESQLEGVAGPEPGAPRLALVGVSADDGFDMD